MNTNTIAMMVAEGAEGVELVVAALEEPTVATQRCPDTDKPAAAAVAKVGNKYPFRTKAEILAQLAVSSEARHEALLVLYRRQTEDEQQAKDTRWKNRRGFMSSHAVNGTKLAEKLISGEPLTGEEEAKVSGIVCRYGKQLAAHAREQALAEAPELGAQAAAFFKPQA